MSGNLSIDDVKQSVNDFFQSFTSNPRSKRRDVLTCDKELGKWVVRLNNVTIEEFFRYSAAQRLITKIEAALENKNEG